MLYVRDGSFSLPGGGLASTLRGLILTRGGEVNAPSLSLIYDPSVARALDWLGLDLAGAMVSARRGPDTQPR